MLLSWKHDMQKIWSQYGEEELTKKKKKERKKKNLYAI